MDTASILTPPEGGWQYLETKLTPEDRAKIVKRFVDNYDFHGAYQIWRGKYSGSFEAFKSMILSQINHILAGYTLYEPDDDKDWVTGSWCANVDVCYCRKYGTIRVQLEIFETLVTLRDLHFVGSPNTTWFERLKRWIRMFPRTW